MVPRPPDAFKFVVKMAADVSHNLEIAAVGPFLESLEPLRRAGRLAGLLCQFPERFHCNRAGHDFLRDLAGRWAEYRGFVEFRHRSWDSAEALDEVAALGFEVVSVDVPDIAALFPRRLVRVGRTVYVRFHSRNERNWYADGKDRYDYRYSEPELV